MTCEIRNQCSISYVTRIAGLVLIMGMCHVQCGCVAPLDFLAFKGFDEDTALEDLVDISDEKGPLERALGFTHRNRSFSELSEEERKEFEDAEKLVVGNGQPFEDDGWT